LTFLEELADQGQDLGRLVIDLLEHLRHVLLVQHMGEVPDSLPLTDETRERLRAQANQLSEATVLRLCDLLAVAVDDMRQGGDPRLPLELALVKVTRPAADMERESIAYRLEQLESRGPSSPVQGPGPETGPEEPRPEPSAAAGPPSIELAQLQEAWQRTILPAVEQRSIPTASMLREAHPSQLAEDRLTVEFPAAASFHRQLAEEPKNATLLAEALYEVTGRKLALDFAVGENGGDAAEEEEEPAGEEEIVQLMKDTFDAREVKGDSD
jgi:DNA polymerase III gamma/tau subunit